MCLKNQNLELVEAALNQVRSALASQIAWTEIEELLTEAQEENDPVACAIRELKLKTNQIVVFLAEPDWGDEDSDESGSDISGKGQQSQVINNLGPKFLGVLFRRNRD